MMQSRETTTFLVREDCRFQRFATTDRNQPNASNFSKFKRNKTGMSKVGAKSKAQKAESVEKMVRTFMKNSQKTSKHRKGAFRDRQTLQKFRYSY